MSEAASSVLEVDGEGNLVARLAARAESAVRPDLLGEVAVGHVAEADSREETLFKGEREDSLGIAALGHVQHGADEKAADPSAAKRFIDCQGAEFLEAFSEISEGYTADDLAFDSGYEKVLAVVRDVCARARQQETPPGGAADYGGDGFALRKMWRLADHV